MRQIKGAGFTRISKKDAKKLHSEGRDVYLLASKIAPWNMYMKPSVMGADADFDSAVNSYMYYNCNKDTGNEVYYYMRM